MVVKQAVNIFEAAFLPGPRFAASQLVFGAVATFWRRCASKSIRPPPGRSVPCLIRLSMLQKMTFSTFIPAGGSYRFSA